MTDGFATNAGTNFSATANSLGTALSGDGSTHTDFQDGDQQVAAATILTAAYQKDQIISAYNSLNTESITDFEWYNVGIGTSDIYSSTNPQMSLHIMLNPSLVEKNSAKENEADAYAPGRVYHYLKEYSKNTAYDVTANDDYLYTRNGFVTYAKTALTINGAFEQLGESVARLTGATYLPITTSVASSNDVFITFTDRLGTGMQLTEGSALSVELNGVTYTGTVPTGGKGSVALKKGDDTLLSSVTIDETSVIFKLNAEELPVIKFASRMNPGIEYDYDNDGTKEVYQKDTVLPIRLKYTVSPIVKEVAKLTKEAPYIYSNAFSSTDNAASGSATAVFIPRLSNYYYYTGAGDKLSETDVAKEADANLTATAANSSSFAWNGSSYVTSLGNNGRLQAIAKVEITPDLDAQVPGGSVVYTVTATNFTDEDVEAEIDAAFSGVTLDGTEGATSKDWGTQTISTSKPWTQTVPTHLLSTAVVGTTYTQSANISVNKSAEADTDVLAAQGYTVTVNTLLNNVKADLDDISTYTELFLKTADGKYIPLTASTTATGVWSTEALAGTYSIVTDDSDSGVVLDTVTVTNADVTKDLYWATAKVETKLDGTDTDLSGITGSDTLKIFDGINTFELTKTDTGIYESAPIFYSKDTLYSILNGTEPTNIGSITVTKTGATKVLNWVKPVVNTLLDGTATKIDDITGDETLYISNSGKKIALSATADTGVYKASEAIQVADTGKKTYTVINDDDTPETYGSLDVGLSEANETTIKWLKPVVITRLDNVEADIDDITGDAALYLGAGRIELVRTAEGSYVAQDSILAPAAATDYYIYNSDAADAEQYGKVIVKDSTDAQYNKAILDWYTVQFETEQGTAPDDLTVAKGETIVDPGTPADADAKYEFIKWATDDTFVTEFDFLNTKITAPTTIYGEWDEKTVKITDEKNDPDKLPQTLPEEEIEVVYGTMVCVDPNVHGRYNNSYTEKSHFPVTEDELKIELDKDDNGLIVEPGWVFTGWVRTVERDDSGEIEIIQYTAQYLEDVVGDADDPENAGDGIPDIYEKKVTYTITNGAWDDAGTAADVVEYVPLTAIDGSYTRDGSGELAAVPDVCSAVADDSYTQDSGEWTSAVDPENGQIVSGNTPVQHDYIFTEEKTYPLIYSRANDPENIDQADVKHNRHVTILPEGGVFEDDIPLEFDMSDEGDPDVDEFTVPAPEKEHHVFNGWEKSVDPDGNVTLTALWIEKLPGTVPEAAPTDDEGDPEGMPTPVELELEPGEGVYVVPHEDTDLGEPYHVQINSADDYDKIEEPYEEGMVFVGWTIDDTYYEEYEPVSGGMYICVKKLIANYAPDEIGNSYDPDGDGSDGVPDCFQKPITYTVVNGNWSDKDSVPTDVKTEYVTLYDDDGNWSKDGKGYLSIPDVSKTEPDEGYINSGAWEFGADEFPAGNEVSGLESENFNYEFNTLKTYKVYYDSNGQLNENGDPVKYPYAVKTFDEDLELIQPEWAGHTFDGWLIQGTDTVILPDELYTLNEDATLVAQWTLHTHDITYPERPDPDQTGEDPQEETVNGVPYGAKVRFRPNGGTFRGLETDTVLDMPDEDIDASPDPIREGYTFNGWLVDDEGDELVFTAQWIKDKTVEYNEYKDDEPVDGIPDTESAPASITLPYKKYILVDPNGGKYNSTSDPTLLKITKDLTDIDMIGNATAPEGKVFVGWKLEASGEYGGTAYVYKLVARYADDSNLDGIADVFEKKLTYKVVNGTWDNEGNADPIVEWVPLYDTDGKLSVNGIGEAKSFPDGMLPLVGYTSEDAKWDPDKPVLTEITKDTAEEYTYTFPKSIKVTFPEYKGDDKPFESKETISNDTRTITIIPNGGTYDGKTEPFTEPLTDDVSLLTPTAPGGKVFMGWEEKIDEKGNLTYIAHYVDDRCGDSSDPDNKGDGIPDCFQKRIEYCVVNGKWNDDTSKGSENRIEYVTLMKDGKMSVDGSAEIALPKGMVPADGFFADRTEDKGWDPEKTGEPMVVTGTQPQKYTFTFHGVTLYFSVEQDKEPVPTEEKVDASKKLTIDPNGGKYRGTKKNTVIDPIGTTQNIGDPTPPSGYRFSGWHITEDAKTGDITLTATYQKIVTSPKTGDDSDRLLWFCLTMAFACGLSVIVVSYTKEIIRKY